MVPTAARHGESNPEPCRPSGRQGGPANGCLRAAIWRKSYHIRLPIDGEGAGTATAAETAATATRETVEIEPGDNPSCSPISRTAFEAAFACASDMVPRAGADFFWFLAIAPTTLTRGALAKALRARLAPLAPPPERPYSAPVRPLVIRASEESPSKLRWRRNYIEHLIHK